jgi:RNA-directed DNA polymerase
MEDRAMSHRKETEAMVEAQPIEDWTQIPWRKLEKKVYRLQKRIYQASLRGDEQAVHSLQRLLMKSEAARTLAVRRVTQDNQGKRTAGVDGVKSVAPAERLVMVKRLRHHKTIKPQPTRRVWIPKPGKSEKRPLGIPTMLDRSHQYLVKLALEPEWEARFEANSYGFRPGRSTHDAIAAIFNIISKQPKYVLDADIANCFNNINHVALLEKLHTYPALRRTIKAWLKAGVLEDHVFASTEAGTPQGGTISPLLANVALHGMEQAVQAGYNFKGRDKPKPKLVRYADDLVVFFPTREGIEKAKTALETWLTDIGLEMKPSKTRIAHTLQALEGEPPGFDFLGFEVRQYPVGKYRSGKHNGKRLGFKTIIQPSKEAIKRHREELRKVVHHGQGLTQAALIGQLNPKIRGWSHYYRSVASKKALNDCDYHLFPLLLRWAKRRHPRKSASWITHKYWRTVEQDHWRFATLEGPHLTNHASIPIQRHVKVKGRASPFDGNLLYWARRLQQSHPLTMSRLGALLYKQQGKCRYCELHFRDGDLIEIDHITPRSQGGKDERSNLAALHRHCHDQRHATLYGGGIHDKDGPTEELDELETLMSSSGGGQEGAIPLA